MSFELWLVKADFEVDWACRRVFFWPNACVSRVRWYGFGSILFEAGHEVSVVSRGTYVVLSVSCSAR